MNSFRSNCQTECRTVSEEQANGHISGEKKLTPAAIQAIEGFLAGRQENPADRDSSCPPYMSPSVDPDDYSFVSSV